MARQLKITFGEVEITIKDDGTAITTSSSSSFTDEAADDKSPGWAEEMVCRTVSIARDSEGWGTEQWRKALAFLPATGGTKAYCLRRVYGHRLSWASIGRLIGKRRPKAEADREVERHGWRQLPTEDDDGMLPDAPLPKLS